MDFILENKFVTIYKVYSLKLATNFKIKLIEMLKSTKKLLDFRIKGFRLLT